MPLPGRPFVPDPTPAIRAKSKAGDTSAFTETSALLKWFGYERRTPYAVALIRAHWAMLELLRSPTLNRLY